MSNHTIPKPSKVSTCIIELGGKDQSLATQMCLGQSRRDLVLYFRIVVRPNISCVFLKHAHGISTENDGDVMQSLFSMSRAAVRGEESGADFEGLEAKSIDFAIALPRNVHVTC